jgi:hypothetical protein
VIVCHEDILPEQPGERGRHTRIWRDDLVRQP